MSGRPGADHRDNEPDWVVRPVPRGDEPAPVGTPRPDTVLEFGEPPAGGPRRDWNRRLPFVLAAVALLAFAVYAVRRTDLSATPQPTRSAAARPTSPTPAAAASTADPSAVATIAVTDAGGPLFGGSAGWELIARGPSGVVRIEPARGRITRTTVPALASTGPVSFLVGRDWTMVRPLDSVAGYLVPDGQPARELGGELSHGGQVLPGPDAATVWVTRPENSGSTMALVDTLGRPTGPTLSVPPDANALLTTDGTGYVIFQGIGGGYDIRADGTRRITPGWVVAAGPTRWLVLECDDQHRCATAVIDRATGARRDLNVATEPYGLPSVIAPDGSRAAFTTTDPTGQTVTHLLDLDSGANHILAITGEQSGDYAIMAWSPDSRWLFVVTVAGTLYPVDAATAQVRPLGFDLPPVTQVAIRTVPPS